MTRFRCNLLVLTGLALVAPALDQAAAQAPSAPVTIPTPGGDVTVVADRMEQVGPDNLLVATGNVEVVRGTARLTADRVEINRATDDAVAEGRVIFYDGEDRLTGDRIEYNLRSGTGVIYHADAHVTPYYRITGERMERLGPSRYHVRPGVFTTCEEDPPAWSFRFGDAEADLEEWIHGTDASVWIKKIPVVPYLPFFAAALRRERQTGFLFPRYGSSTRKGLFVEIPFYWAISDSQDATFTFDAYQKKGFGGAGEYRYILSDTQRGTFRGFFLKETEAKQIPDSGHDDNRGYGSFKHDWLIGPGLVFKADVNGVTDNFVFHDYSDQLQERSAQRVESNVFLTKSWPTWNAVGTLFAYQDLTTDRPVALQRLPEIRVQGVRQPLPGLPRFLYEMESRYTNFVREEGSSGQRLDLHPRVSRPVPVFGFFTVTPFVGGRATAYDKKVLTHETDRGGVDVERTETEFRLRRLVEAGTDFDLRAARVYNLGGFAGMDAVIHSIEPHINYTWIEGEDLGRLPQWTTGIDDIKRTSLVTYTLVNRIRARTVAPEGTEPVRWEYVRFTVGHSYDFKADTRPFGNLTGDLIVDPNRVLRFRGDTAVSVYGDGVQTGNTDLSLNVRPVIASVGTRFDKVNKVNFLQGGFSADVLRWLTTRVSTNWDLRSLNFVETRFGLDLKWQCWAFSLEFISRHKNEDELRFTLNLLGVGAPLTTGTGLGALGGGGGSSSTGTTSITQPGVGGVR